MMLCDFPRNARAWRIVGLWVLAVLITAPAALADFPEESPPSADAIWPEELPQQTTRIYWAWPEFLSQQWKWPEYEDPASVPLDRPSPAKWKSFGLLDWLSPAAAPKPSPQILDSYTFRAENDGMNSPWFFDAPASDYELTLVRGGVPQLFGARGRIRGEYGDEFDDVKRIRGQLLWSFNGRVGIDASVNSWEDNRPRPEALGDFWTGDANFVYTLGAQRVAMRGGVGAAWIYDNDLDVGYNLLYGADLFLTRPWLVSAEVDWGRISSDKLLHWRATFGAQLLRFELYIGYDSYRLGDIRFDGPVAGAGIWF